jgi:hypothetical protein
MNIDILIDHVMGPEKSEVFTIVQHEIRDRDVHV